MVGWLYIDNQVAAPVRLLEIDSKTGLVSIEVSAKFVENRALLRGHTVLEYRGWKHRRLVRCLGAEEVGAAMMIDAVDLGHVEPEDQSGGADGHAEDWLIVDGQARSQVKATRIGVSPGSATKHCMFHVPLDAWRDLRIGEDAALACVGVHSLESDGTDGSITPLLHSARDLGSGDAMPVVELIRLRERLRYHIHPLATDWGEHTTLVVSRVIEGGPL